MWKSCPHLATFTLYEALKGGKKPVKSSFWNKKGTTTSPVVGVDNRNLFFKSENAYTQALFFKILIHSLKEAETQSEVVVAKNATDYFFLAFDTFLGM